MKGILKNLLLDKLMTYKFPFMDAYEIILWNYVIIFGVY